jgi:hypothetical protein
MVVEPFSQVFIKDNFFALNFYDFVIKLKIYFSVMPAKAGIL